MEDDLNDFDGSEGIPLEDLGLGGSSAEPAGGDGTPPSGAPVEAVTPAQATPASAPAAAAEPWAAPPKSWKTETHAQFSALAPEVKQYIHQREEQALQGIMQYKQRVDGYEAPFRPYQEQLQAAGIDPQVLVANFAQNHAILTMGSAEQKLELARRMLQDYRIDPRSLIFGESGQQQPQQQAPQLPPEIAQLPQVVGQLHTHYMNQRRSEVKSQIDKFAENHPHFQSVEGEMAQLINSGAAQGLDDAYEIAVYRNPEIHQKILAEQIAKSTQQSQQVAAAQKKASSVNLRSVGSAPASARPGSMDDTLNAIASKHFSG